MELPPAEGVLLAPLPFLLLKFSTALFEANVVVVFPELFVGALERLWKSSTARRVSSVASVAIVPNVCADATDCRFTRADGVEGAIPAFSTAATEAPDAVVFLDTPPFSVARIDVAREELKLGYRPKLAFSTARLEMSVDVVLVVYVVFVVYVESRKDLPFSTARMESDAVRPSPSSL
jgi:hypothetical protein